MDRDIVIVGGGLAGLINAIILSRSGLSVTLIEKKSYPFHRVCGEYISNEVSAFLKRNKLYPDDIDVSNINRFLLTSTNGKQSKQKLELGGFGISRYTLDNFLYEKARASDVEFKLNTTVENVDFEDGSFNVKFDEKSIRSKIVIGSQGKRSILDKKLGRDFMKRKSPYLGVKYHIKTDFPADTIALHNFKDGYCGISKVEGDTFNLCYLSHRKNIQEFGSIQETEKSVLYKNPFLKNILTNSDFLFEKPLVINEINFEHKKLVDRNVLMCGDAAGMIAPLCGNGMAMAIHSAKILSEIILKEWKNGDFDRRKIEEQYIQSWNKEFFFRLWSGRKIQQLFGSEITSNLAVGLTKVNPIAKRIIRLTHGKPF